MADALIRLIEDLDINGVDKFIEDGGDVNGISDKSPLMSAIMSKSYIEYDYIPYYEDDDNVSPNEGDKISIGDKIIIRLIKAGCDVNVTGYAKRTPLLEALYYKKSYKVIYQLLNSGADVKVVDFTSSSPLIYAIKRNYNNQLINDLISRGADLNHQDDDNTWTALCYALDRKRYEVITTLIDAGAGVNFQSKDGKNVLIGRLDCRHCKLGRCKNKKLIDLFISKGLDLKYIDEYGRTIIHDTNCNYLISLCIECGVSVDLKDGFGETALLLAIKLGNFEKVWNLLRLFNADSNATDDKLQSPLHYIIKSSHYKSCEILLYHGGDLFFKSPNNTIPLEYFGHHGSLHHFCRPSSKLVEMPGLSIIKHCLLYFPGNGWQNNINPGVFEIKQFVNNFKVQCRSELTGMKNTFLTDTLTIYDFCILKRYYNSQYIDVGKSVDEYKIVCKEIKQKFPLYHNMIIIRIKDNHVKHIERHLRCCLENVIIRPLAVTESETEDSEQVELIYDCKRIIASHFDRNHLYNLFLASVDY